MTVDAVNRKDPRESWGQEPADVLVIFGITGDLARVMTFRSLYRLEARGLLTCPIVGVAVDDVTDDQLRERAREAIRGTEDGLDAQVLDRLAERLSEALRPEPISLDMEFAREGGEGPMPYETLLHAAMSGVRTRFTRQDGVEETWRIVQPLLDAPPPVHPYLQGSWGPAAAADVVAGHRAWHEPWVVS